MTESARVRDLANALNLAAANLRAVPRLSTVIATTDEGDVQTFAIVVATPPSSESTRSNAAELAALGRVVAGQLRSQSQHDSALADALEAAAAAVEQEDG